jgi:hypothetical protein
MAIIGLENFMCSPEHCVEGDDPTARTEFGELSSCAVGVRHRWLVRSPAAARPTPNGDIGKPGDVDRRQRRIS